MPQRVLLKIHQKVDAKRIIPMSQILGINKVGISSRKIVTDTVIFIVKFIGVELKT